MIPLVRIGLWISIKLKGLADFADDSEFQSKFMGIKKRNKEKLAKIILQETGIEVSSEAIFDIQIKRLHEYKRQHLNFLYIMTLVSAFVSR